MKLCFSVWCSLSLSAMVLPTFGAGEFDATVYLSVVSDLSDYREISDNVRFVVEKSLAYTPDSYAEWTAGTPLISGGSFTFTSGSNEAAPYDLSISEGGQVFLDTSCRIDGLGTVEISSNEHSGSGRYQGSGDNWYTVWISHGSVLYNADFAAVNNVLVELASNKALAKPEPVLGMYSSASAYGGAVFSEQFHLQNNNQVRCDDNEAFAQAKGNAGAGGYAQGGAVYSQSVSITNNEELSFSGNRASATTVDSVSEGASMSASGGAVYSTGEIMVCGNIGGEITIADNASKVYSNVSGTLRAMSTGRGGAMFADGRICLDANSDISISSNYAVAEAHAGNTKPNRAEAQSGAYGGAIYAKGDLSIRNNDTVSFSSNHVEAYARAAVSGSTTYENVTAGSVAQGGAIYAQNSVRIIGNQAVTFEGNYESTRLGNEAYTYRLRSIYMAPDAADDTLELAAEAGGHITFYDSVYMGNYANAAVSLNAEYKDADDVTQKATGDIVFSGKLTGSHLKKIKGGTNGTAAEIAASRTSELLNTVNLYGGTLRVEDSAVLKTHAINVASESKAVLKVANAEVNALGYDVTVNKTAQLVLEGGVTDGVLKSALLRAGNVVIADAAGLTVRGVTTNSVAIEESALFTLDTTRNTGYDASRAYNLLAGGQIDADLLTLSEGAVLDMQGAHLAMSSGELTLAVTSVSTAERIELNLTLSADYDPNAQVVLFSDVSTVNFISDGITAKSTDGVVYTLSAADYFGGARITDATTLVYDAANKVVYLEGVANVPEPASATLSLLALSGLLARRRRGMR